MSEEVKNEIQKRIDSKHEFYLLDNTTGEKIIIDDDVKKLIANEQWVTSEPKKYYNCWIGVDVSPKNSMTVWR